MLNTIILGTYQQKLLKWQRKKTHVVTIVSTDFSIMLFASTVLPQGAVLPNPGTSALSRSQINVDRM